MDTASLQHLTLNAYGDRVKPTTGTHGVDVAAQRMDELDRDCLKAAIDNTTLFATAADIGCGTAIQGFRLAMLGCNVWLYDLMDIRAHVQAFSSFVANDLHFIHKDIVTISDEEIPTSLGILYSQRFVHYLPFASACTLLSRFVDRMIPGGMAYLSASGINSELGNDYPHSQRRLEDRFAPLSPLMATKHQILHEVCLYSEEDLTKLGIASGLSPISVKRSSFGNIKGVFQRT